MVEGSLAEVRGAARRRGAPRARREAAAPRSRAGGRHADRAPTSSTRAAPATSSTTSRRSTASSSSPSRRPRRRRRRSCGTPSRRAGSRRRFGRGCASGGWSGSTTRSSCRSPPSSRTWRTRGSGSTRTGWARSPPGSPSGSRSSRRSALDLAGEEFQLGSTQQLARILFEKLGLTTGRKGKTGYSTDARVLRAIRDDHAIVPVVEEWRELTKLLNTYLLPLPALIDERDGRLHTTINQAVAATGRLSTTSPNLQSIPVRTELGRRIRSAFVADGGYPAAVGRLQPGRAPHPRARLGRARAARGVRARRGHPRGDRVAGVRRSRRRSSRAASATRRRWSTSGSSTGSRRSGSPRTSASRARRRRS